MVDLLPFSGRRGGTSCLGSKGESRSQRGNILGSYISDFTRACFGGTEDTSFLVLGVKQGELFGMSENIFVYLFSKTSIPIWCQPLYLSQMRFQWLYDNAGGKGDPKETWHPLKKLRTPDPTPLGGPEQYHGWDFGNGIGWKIDFYSFFK